MKSKLRVEVLKIQKEKDQKHPKSKLAQVKEGFSLKKFKKLSFTVREK